MPRTPPPPIIGLIGQAKIELQQQQRKSAFAAMHNEMVFVPIDDPHPMSVPPVIMHEPVPIRPLTQHAPVLEHAWLPPPTGSPVTGDCMLAQMFNEQYLQQMQNNIENRISPIIDQKINNDINQYDTHICTITNILRKIIDHLQEHR